MPTRKPRRLKVISGTLQPSRDRPELELPVVDAPPEAPDFLDIEGAKEFDRAARYLHGAGVLAACDLGVLTAYAASWAGLVRHWRYGLPTKAADLTAFRQLASDLAMTPRSRASLPPVDRAVRPNKFITNGLAPKR